LRAWPQTFDGHALTWITTSGHAVDPQIVAWIGNIGIELKVDLRILDRAGHHPGFGLRIQVPATLDLLDDARMPSLLRRASDVAGQSGVILETAGGDRLTFVIGEGVFGRINGTTYEAEALRDSADLEKLEASGLPLSGRMTP
jgi:hypothetical protein